MNEMTNPEKLEIARNLKKATMQLAEHLDKIRAPDDKETLLVLVTLYVRSNAACIALGMSAEELKKD